MKSSSSFLIFFGYCGFLDICTLHACMQSKVSVRLVSGRGFKLFGIVALRYCRLGRASVFSYLTCSMEALVLRSVCLEYGYAHGLEGGFLYVLQGTVLMISARRCRFRLGSVEG